MATGENLAAFLFGLVVLEAATGITLRGLTFYMPIVPFGTGSANAQPAWSIGVLAGAATGLTVEQCRFVAHPASAYVFSAGLIVVGAADHLTVRRNSFVASRFVPGAMVFGVLATVVGADVTTSLDNAEISDNLFEHLGAGVVTFSELGFVRCTGNRVVDCGTGLFFAASNLAATSEVARLSQVDAAQQPQHIVLSQAIYVGLQAPMLAGIVNTAAHIATRSPQPPPQVSVSDIAHNVLVEDVTTRGSAAWNTFARASHTPSPTKASAAAPTEAASASAPVVTDQSLQTVREISIAAEVAGHLQTPVLHLSGNDVTLVNTETTPGIGIGIVFSPRDESGTVLLTANRVTAPNLGTSAAAILFPAIAAVTGNVFVQASAKIATVAAAFTLLAQQTSEIEVAANVIHTSAIVFPARSNTGPAANWNFLNTVK
jgi:hypothetical protein